jgi:hypothetical protein
MRFNALVRPGRAVEIIEAVLVTFAEVIGLRFAVRGMSVEGRSFRRLSVAGEADPACAGHAAGAGTNTSMADGR